MPLKCASPQTVTLRSNHSTTLKGNVYQARLTIPKDVSNSLGLAEFTQSLETSDLKVANTRGDACIRDWKRKIATRRGREIWSVQI